MKSADFVENCSTGLFWIFFNRFNVHFKHLPTQFRHRIFPFPTTSIFHPTIVKGRVFRPPFIQVASVYVQRFPKKMGRKRCVPYSCTCAFRILSCVFSPPPPLSKVICQSSWAVEDDIPCVCSVGESLGLFSCLAICGAFLWTFFLWKWNILWILWDYFRCFF